MTDIYKAPKTNSYKVKTPTKKDYIYCRAITRCRKSRGILPIIILSAILSIFIMMFMSSRLEFSFLSFVFGIGIGIIFTIAKIPWFWSSIEKFHRWEDIDEVMGTSS